MKRNLIIVILFPLIIITVSFFTRERPQKYLREVSIEETPSTTPIRIVTPKDLSFLNKELDVSIKERGNTESIIIKSYLKELFDGKIDIYSASTNKLLASTNGLIWKAFPVDIENDKNEELVVQAETGQSVDTSIYKYLNGNLKKIQISNGAAVYESTTTRNPPEFKDTDKDGKLEMFVYYRFFPPEKRRRVEVYKFNGQKFTKINEYEETTDDFYL